MKIQLKVLLSSAAITLALASSAQAVQFVGAGTGAIPDGAGVTTCGSPGAPLAITFPVAGLMSNVSNVGLRLTMTHTWVGDLTVTLSGPGGVPSFVVFGAVGSTTAAGCGNANDPIGTYNYNDGFASNWWTTAVLVGGTPIPSGNYTASTPGGTAGATGPATSFNAVFGGLTPAAANGTWTLSVTDGGVGDTGSITAATLFINETAPVSLQNFSVD